MAKLGRGLVGAYHPPISFGLWRQRFSIEIELFLKIISTRDTYEQLQNRTDTEIRGTYDSLEGMLNFNIFLCRYIFNMYLIYYHSVW
jgi:hypothetical protein